MFDSFSKEGISMSNIGLGSGLQASSVAAHVQDAPKPHKKASVTKIKFTEEEDQKLKDIVSQVGAKDWIRVSQMMGTRNPRQCRERWNNYINPNLRTDPWTPEEDILLNQKILEFGQKWNKISKFFKNRSDNNIRNRWMMIARHRSKQQQQQQKSPISPAPTQPQQMMMPQIPNVCPTLPYIQPKIVNQVQRCTPPKSKCETQVVKEESSPEFKDFEIPFGQFAFTSMPYEASEPVMDECDLDMWNEFSFY